MSPNEAQSKPSSDSISQGRLRRGLDGIISDYGMLFVLVLLMGVFSVLTIKQQSLTGASGGTAVGNDILDRLNSGNVFIAVPDSMEDRAFAAAVRQTLTEKSSRGSGETSAFVIVGESIGSPGDARRAIEKVLQSGVDIDLVAVSGTSSTWTIFEKIPQIPREKLAVPQTGRWPDFLKASNLIGVANQTAIYAVIAIGMTMVIIVGGIDLSVGSIVALSSVVAAVIIRDQGGVAASTGLMTAACIAGVLVAAIAGVINGLLVTQAALPSFIVTLAMMLMGRGLALRLSDSQSINALPSSFRWLGGGTTYGIPNPILVMVVLYAVAYVVMSRTIFGRVLYAIGGNAEAARLCGVQVQKVRLVVYTLSAALAGLGGVMLSSRLNAGDPKYGNMYELEVIAAVVVGGTSLMGGEGKILGSLIGALIVAVIRNGMNLLDVKSENQLIVLGMVLLLSLLIDTWKRGGVRRS
jgi:ribose transport system permease protein